VTAFEVPAPQPTSPLELPRPRLALPELWVPDEDDLWVPSDDELELLSDDEVEELCALLERQRRDEDDRLRLQPKQMLAWVYAQMVDELLYGGAAGGGKTFWLIAYVSALMEQFPGNRGVIFRRVFPSLSRTVIPRAKMYLAGRALWNGSEHTFTFPNGSVLELASLQYSDTVMAHQGTEYGVVGFEEVTEFLQSQYEFLLGRLRSPAVGVRPHAVATTNPGGVGHRWVKRRWVKVDVDTDVEPGEPRPEPYRPWRPRFDPEIHDADSPPLVRCFIPATLDDNPALQQRDPQYRSRVRANTNRGLRLAMEKGDWDAIDAVEGALWSQVDLDRGRLSVEFAARHRPAARRVVAVDPSDGDEGGDEYGIWLGYRATSGEVLTTGSWALNGMSPREMAKFTMNLYREEACDAIAVERNHGGKWLVEVLRTESRYANIVTVWASENKRTRAEPVSALFEPDDSQPPHLRYRARLVGSHPELEEELTTTAFEKGETSPNRLDALVWGHAELVDLSPRPRVVESGYEDLRLDGRR
jgi:hypothetical protein